MTPVKVKVILLAVLQLFGLRYLKYPLQKTLNTVTSSSNAGVGKLFEWWGHTGLGSEQDQIEGVFW